MIREGFYIIAGVATAGIAYMWGYMNGWTHSKVDSRKVR